MRLPGQEQLCLEHTGWPHSLYARHRAARNKVGSVRVDFTRIGDVVPRRRVDIAYDTATSRARRGRGGGGRRRGEDGLHEERRASLQARGIGRLDGLRSGG
jgi:hypothetical protein